MGNKIQYVQLFYAIDNSVRFDKKKGTKKAKLF